MLSKSIGNNKKYITIAHENCFSANPFAAQLHSKKSTHKGHTRKAAVVVKIVLLVVNVLSLQNVNICVEKESKEKISVFKRTWFYFVKKNSPEDIYSEVEALNLNGTPPSWFCLKIF